MPSFSSLLVGLSGPTTVLKANTCKPMAVSFQCTTKPTTIKKKKRKEKVFKAKLAQRHVKRGEAWGKRDTNSQRPFPGETAQAGLDLSSTGL